MRRAAISSYFSKTRIEALEPFLRKRVELLCESLRRQAQDGPVEVLTLFLAFAEDTVCSYAFDYSMDLLEDSQRGKEWRTMISDSGDVIPFIKQFPWIIPVVKRVPLRVLNAAAPKVAGLLTLQAVSRNNPR